MDDFFFFYRLSAVSKIQSSFGKRAEEKASSIHACIERGKKKKKYEVSSHMAPVQDVESISSLQEMAWYDRQDGY